MAINWEFSVATGGAPARCAPEAGQQVWWSHVCAPWYARILKDSIAELSLTVLYDFSLRFLLQVRLKAHSGSSCFSLF